MNYQKIYDSLIQRAKYRTVDFYTESHHILPKCLGGDNSLSNLVRLSPEEHYLAHLLLVKIFPNNDKIVLAARYMTVDHNGTRVNNKMYGWLKRKHSEVRKNFVYSEQARKKMSLSASGRKSSDEKRRKCSIAGKKAKGILKTEEHKQALKLAAKNRPRATCEHCGKDVQINMYHRWHGDKCKHK